MSISGVRWARRGGRSRSAGSTRRSWSMRSSASTAMRWRRDAADRRGYTLQIMASIIVFAPHPDDAELGMGGTILKLVAQGHKLVIADMTTGEPTPFGSEEI